MRCAALISTAFIAAFATSVRAQGIKPTDVAGSWNTKATVGTDVSVAVTSLITVSPDGKTWTTKFPGRDPLPTRVVAMGGDSVVTEAGPYPSMLRPGQTVTLLRTVSHFKGDKNERNVRGALRLG